jgi:hypothetical protein
VYPCDGDCPGDIEKAVNELSVLIYDTIPNNARLKHIRLDNVFYRTDQPGDNETIKRIAFSFRKDDEYFKGEFMVFEDRWQQLARLGGKDGKPWEEKAVKGIAGETYPFPGKDRFTSGTALQRFDLEMVQADGDWFRDKSRNSGSGSLAGEYENPKYGKPNPGSLKNDYKVIE